MNKTDIYDKFQNCGIEITQKTAEKFAIYGEMLIAWNKKMNLTAVTDEKEILSRHFIDSLLPLASPYVFSGAVCADVGSGAGFPGLPLAIMRPDIEMTLFDSLKKRVEFLEAVTGSVDAKNVKSSIHMRAEDAAKGAFRENFDIALSRAVSNLSTLAELCLPLVKVGGYMLALKSVSVREELAAAQNAIKILGGEFTEIFGTNERNIAVIKKTAPTPPIYPRKAGTPEKRSL